MNITYHDNDDWCHTCGERNSPTADVSYPENAEHGGANKKYIRICSTCASRVLLACKPSGLTGPDLVSFGEHCLEIKANQSGYIYDIEYSRIDSPEKLIGWISHLCRKSWFSKDHILQIIRSSKRLGVNIGNVRPQ